MNAKDIKILLEALGVRQYRWEIIKDYIESPLKFGVGFEEFQLMNMLIPVLPVGPTGKPVPGGAMVTALGVPKYPAATLQNLDMLYSYGRAAQIRDADSIGQEVFPVTAGLTGDFWHSGTSTGTLAAGAIANHNLGLGGVAGRFTEIVLHDVMFTALEDDADMLNIHGTVKPSAGGVYGCPTFAFNYLNDVTNGIYNGEARIQFSEGLRIMANSVQRFFLLDLSGGAGTEDFIVNYSYRYLV